MNNLPSWGFGGEAPQFIPAWGYGGQFEGVLWVEDPAPGGATWNEPPGQTPDWVEASAPGAGGWVEASPLTSAWDEDDPPVTPWSEH